MSDWYSRCAIPVHPFLITDAKYNEQFWVISQTNINSNLEIFNYDANNNKFTQYLHKIDSPQNVLSASYDETHNVLYIVGSFKIIAIDIKTNEFKTIWMDQNKIISPDHCASVVDNIEKQLHIVTNGFYCVLDYEQTCLKRIHAFDYYITQPRIVQFLSMKDKKATYMRITGMDVLCSNALYLYGDRYDENNTLQQMSCKDIITGRKKIYTYNTIRYAKEDLGRTYTLGFNKDKIMLQYLNPQSNCETYITVFSDVKTPFVPEYSNFMKQSSTRNNTLLIGYMKMFTNSRIIPIDVIHIINRFYSWYDLHLFTTNGNHCAMSIDTIINNSQQYTGVIKQYDVISPLKYYYTIQIKGRIDAYSRGFPIIQVGEDHIINKLTNEQKPIINALKQMFKMFARNKDNNIMSIGDMKKYILHCGADEESASDSRVQLIFENYGKTEMELDVNGFIDFYADAICERPDYVMNDFKVFGYEREDLFKATGACVYGYGEEFLYINEEVNFNVKVEHDDGTKYAVNVTRADVFECDV